MSMALRNSKSLRKKIPTCKKKKKKILQKTCAKMNRPYDICWESSEARED